MEAMQRNLGGHFQSSEDEVILSWSPYVFLCVPICSCRTRPIHLVGQTEKINVLWKYTAGSG